MFVPGYPYKFTYDGPHRYVQKCLKSFVDGWIDAHDFSSRLVPNQENLNMKQFLHAFIYQCGLRKNMLYGEFMEVVNLMIQRCKDYCNAHRFLDPIRF